MSGELNVMMLQIAHLGKISEAEASRIVNDVYRDGIVSREEAEALFQLNDRLSASDPKWSSRFVEAIKDFLLTQEAPEGWVTEEEARWLIARIEDEGEAPSESEIDLMLALLRYADGAHQSLAEFCLNAISERIVEQGVADDAMSERMRRILNAPAGDGSISITRREASVLFATNDAIARAANAKSWENVFAKAILNHLLSAAHPDPVSEQEALSRDAWLQDTDANIGGFFQRMGGAFTSGSWFDKISYSKGAAARARYYAKEVARDAGVKIVPSEQNWLLRRLGWDKSVSKAERRLIDLLNEEAPAFVCGLLEALREDDVLNVGGASA
jgi:hypothetical protein